MKIRNAKGEVKLTPKSQSTQDAKQKAKGKKFGQMSRADKDELLFLLCQLNGIEID